MNRQDAKTPRETINKKSWRLCALAVQNCLADVFLLTSANP